MKNDFRFYKYCKNTGDTMMAVGGACLGLAFVAVNETVKSGGTPDFNFNFTVAAIAGTAGTTLITGGYALSRYGERHLTA